MIKKSYLIRKGMQLIFFWLFAGNAWAACWVTFDGGVGRNSFIDMCSIVTVGQYKKAWVKYEYFQSQKNRNENGRDYIKALVLYYFNCSGRMVGASNINVYSQDGALVDSIEFDGNDIKMTDVVPESLWDIFMTSFCFVTDNNKSIKKHSNNDSDIFTDAPPVEKKIKPKVPNKIM